MFFENEHQEPLKNRKWPMSSDPKLVFFERDLLPVFWHQKSSPVMIRTTRLPSSDSTALAMRSFTLRCTWSSFPGYPLVICYIAIENCHRNSGFTHWKWWFSIVMLVYQRVTWVGFLWNTANNGMIIGCETHSLPSYQLVIRISSTVSRDISGNSTGATQHISQCRRIYPCENFHHGQYWIPTVMAIN